MTATRSENEGNPQESTTDQVAGMKHELDDQTTSASKRSKQDDEKEQATLEETIPR